ncbi:MAG: hypothetical protein V1895_01950 [Parcubacteria group bacterium]
MRTIILMVTCFSIISPAFGEWTMMDKEWQSGIVSGWSGYPGNIPASHSLSMRANGAPCVAWEAWKGVRFGSDIGCACWDDGWGRWVGPQDGQFIDFVGLSGFNAKAVLLALPSNQFVIAAINRPVLNTGTDKPKVIVLTFDGGSWGYTYGLTHGCTANCGDAEMNVAIATDPLGGYGQAVSDGRRIRYVAPSGSVEVVIPRAAGVVTSIKLQYEPSGVAHISYGGVTVGGSIEARHVYRVGPGNWTGYTGASDLFERSSTVGLDINQASGEVSVGLVNTGRLIVHSYTGSWSTRIVNPTGDVAEDDLDLRYDGSGRLYVGWASDTQPGLLLLRRVGSSWENMTGGATPEVVLSIPWGTPHPTIGFDLGDNPHSVFGWSDDVGHRRWKNIPLLEQ